MKMIHVKVLLDMSTLTITPEITKGELSRAVAKFYVGVQRASDKKVILRDVRDVNGIVLSKILPNTFTLTFNDGQIKWNVVDIQIKQSSFFQLKRIIEAIGKPELMELVGEHNIDMIPTLVMLPTKL